MLAAEHDERSYAWHLRYHQELVGDLGELGLVFGVLHRQVLKAFEILVEVDFERADAPIQISVCIQETVQRFFGLCRVFDVYLGAFFFDVYFFLRLNLAQVAHRLGQLN